MKNNNFESKIYKKYAKVVHVRMLNKNSINFFINKITYLFFGLPFPLYRLCFKHKITHLCFSNNGFNTSKVKTVNWIPDFQPIKIKLWPKKNIQAWLKIYKKIASKSTSLIVSSNQSFRDLCEIFPFAQNKTHIVRFSCPVIKKIKLSRRPEKKYKIRKKYIFIPNQFWEHKNYINAIKGVKLAFTNCKDLAVVCCGGKFDFKYNTDTYYKKCLRLIKQLNLQKTVKILGEIPYKDVLSLIKNSHAVLNPSHCEGWSTPVEEAKMFNKNLCLSDISVHKEQAPSAVFFRPSSPKSIASALLKVWAKKKNISHDYKIHNFFTQFNKILMP